MRRPSSPRSPTNNTSSTITSSSNSTNDNNTNATNTANNTTASSSSIISTKQQVFNIHMRPNLEKILKHSIIGECFRKYCSKTMVVESLDCLIDIRNYKNILNNINLNNNINNNINLNNNNINNINNINNLNNNNEIEIYTNAYNIILKIIKLYLNNDIKEINIDNYSKLKILTNESLKSIENYINNLTILEKLEIFDNIEMEMIILLKVDVLPRFVRSQEW